MDSNKVFVERLESRNRQPNSSAPGNSTNAAGDRKYYVHPVTYTTSQWVEANCNTVMFYSLGVGAVEVLGIPLTQNIGLSIPGNRDEVDVTKYYIKFIDPTADNRVLVIRKEYV